MRIQILILGFKGLSEQNRVNRPPSKCLLCTYMVALFFERSLKMVYSAMRIVKANLNLSRHGVLCMLLD